MRNNTIYLIIVILVALIAGYIVAPIDHPAWLEEAVAWGDLETRELRDMKLGLDLQGGTQVLLESDLPTEQ